MLTLFHHPFCPHSRFVRLILEELGQTPRLVEERTWERRQEFLVLNPAGTTPVLVEEGAPPVPGAAVIAEDLGETRGGQRDRIRPRHADDVKTLGAGGLDKRGLQLSRRQKSRSA